MPKPTVSGPSEAHDDADEPSAHLLSPAHSHNTPNQDEAWRLFAPFLLLICVFLLGVYWLVGGRFWWPSGDSHQTTCASGQRLYSITQGDTCWDLARRFDMTVPQLEVINKGIDCNRLSVGADICVLEQDR